MNCRCGGFCKPKVYETPETACRFYSKKDEHFNIGKFSKFFIQKKQKSVSELARKSLNTTLLGECSGSGTASEATFI